MESDPVPPSSPPHATTAELPDSPFFEPRAFSTKSSSPPPLFSSDDSRESADISNYESPRIFKNKRKGGWWDNGEPSQSPLGFKKAKMTRNYDSGVYMMSDATDSSESFPVEHKSPFDVEEVCDLPSRDQTDTSMSLLKGPMNRQEHEFCDRLCTGIDKNSEYYDFSNCELHDQDIGRIGELASVIKNVPDPGDELPAEGQYRSMVPELYVSLKHNKLRHLTPSLFNVTNITSLILGDNQIEELPSEIHRLSNLVELNISNNKLMWLPYELLDVFRLHGRLEVFGDSGVPWLAPKAPQDFDHWGAQQLDTRLIEIFHHANTAKLHLQFLHEFVDAQPNREHLLWCMRQFEIATRQIVSSEAELDNQQLFFPHHASSNRDAANVAYLARTPVSYFDETATLIAGSPCPASKDADFDVITETDRGTHGVPASIFSPPNPWHANSLATMALHTALRHRHHEDLSIQGLRDRIGEPLPPVADAVLNQAERNDCAGFGTFRKCHVCSREYVIARAEWIEWWLPRAWIMIPFKVKVCSWACVPEGMRRRPVKELNWQ